MLDSILKHYPEISGVHPACLAVPEISKDDRRSLEESIAIDGLRHAIILTPDGQLVDGRNRLLACYAANVEPRFEVTSADPWQVAYAENVARRHLEVGQRAMFAAAWKEHEAAKAKERQREHGDTAPGRRKNTSGNISGSDAGDSRDKAADRVGVSGRSVDKAVAVKEWAPDLASDVQSGSVTLEAAYKQAAKRKREAASHVADAVPEQVADADATVVTPAGRTATVKLPKVVKFNATTEAVDWARWTWNPVTGCEHGCDFCYARELAHSSRLAPYYPNQFEPTFHAYRLSAPAATPVPDTGDPRDGRVFVCSMADLFGKWVPDAWIEAVFDACLESPQWEYLFLTKWPARYAQMPLIDRAWYGASVVRQSDVKRVASAMQKIDGNVTRWVSMEPMLEPIRFVDLDWCDLMVIGAQTATNQPSGRVPAFAPKFEWVAEVVDQCRDAGVPYYLKDNLGPKAPGMELPKHEPRRASC